MRWHELRLYQTPNILYTLAYTTPATISAPLPKESKYSATNLVTHLNNRSQERDTYPKTSWIGTEWTEVLSCYVTTETELTQEGHKLEITVDLGQSYFQHAILFVNGIFGDWYHD